EIQVEVRDVGLQRRGEPRRRWLVAGRLCAEGVDRGRGGTHRRAREESGELRTARGAEGVGFEPTESLHPQRFSRWLSSFANPSDFECSRTFASFVVRLVPPYPGSFRPGGCTRGCTDQLRVTHVSRHISRPGGEVS